MNGVNGLGVADRLYYKEQGLLEFTAEVTDIRLQSRRDAVNRWQIALDRTAFYPEGGGQPCDFGSLDAVAPSGTHLNVPVLGVVEDNGEVWHLCEKPLTAGTAITGRIDGPRRRDHMQQHTGQHLLSAIFLSLLNAPTLSFHLGTESATIDLAVGVLSTADLIAVEERVNSVIQEDRPVSITKVARHVAEQMYALGRLRKLPERSGDIRLVEIQGIEWNACGGTHVASTGAIGGLTLRHQEHVKAGIRMEFRCGHRAIRAARHDFETLDLVSNLLSASPAGLPARITSMLEDVRSTAKLRRTLLEEMAGFQAQTVASGRIAEFSARDLEYSRLLASRVVSLYPDRVAIVHTSETDRATVILAAGSASGVRSGTIMKAALETVGAPGGGTDALAQGGIPAAQLGSLLEALKSRIV